MNIAAYVLIGALVSTLLDLAKAVRSKDWNTTVTLLVGFLIGTLVIFLASAATVTSHYQINGIPLVHLDAQSKIVVGMLAVGLFAKVHDLTSAINAGTTPSSTTNVLVPPTPPPPAG